MINPRTPHKECVIQPTSQSALLLKAMSNPATSQNCAAATPLLAGPLPLVPLGAWLRLHSCCPLAQLLLGLFAWLLFVVGPAAACCLQVLLPV